MKTKREMLKSVKNRKSKEASDLVSSILVQIEKSIYDNKRHCIVWVCLLDYSNNVIEKQEKN